MKYISTHIIIRLGYDQCHSNPFWLWWSLKMYEHVLEYDNETWFIDLIEYRMLKLCKPRIHDNKCIQNDQTKQQLYLCVFSITNESLILNEMSQHMHYLQMSER